MVVAPRCTQCIHPGNPSWNRKYAARSSIPFSAIILTIIGVSLSARKRRGGIGWNIGIGIALAFSYIFFLRMSEMFVYTDTLPPAVAMWLPNLLFAIIAAFLYNRARK